MAGASRRAFLKAASAIPIGATAKFSTTEALAADATDHESFVRLSLVLTGLAESEPPAAVEQSNAAGVLVKLYEIYYDRLQSAYPVEFRELLGAWRAVENAADPEAALSQRLTVVGAGAERLRVAARQIVKIWYLSTIDDPRVPLDPKRKGKNSGQVGGDLGQYAHSAIWSLIGAPVPGYSNFPHGYWVERPAPQLTRAVPLDELKKRQSSDLSTLMEIPDG